MLNELELKETALVSAAFVAREEKRGKGGEGEWREIWVGRMDGKRGKRGRKGRGEGGVGGCPSRGSVSYRRGGGGGGDIPPQWSDLPPQESRK